MVRRRKLVLVLAVLLLIPSVLGAAGTYINYDILTYLPPELDSMVGQTYLDGDFHTASTAMITVEHMPPAQLAQLETQLAEVPGVDTVMGGSDLLGQTVPSEMLPEDVQKFF